MRVSIRLGRELEDRLNRASRKLHVDKTQVIKRGLEQYLAQLEPGRTPYTPSSPRWRWATLP